MNHSFLEWVKDIFAFVLWCRYGYVHRNHSTDIS